MTGDKYSTLDLPALNDQLVGRSAQRRAKKKELPLSALKEAPTHTDNVAGILGVAMAEVKSKLFIATIRIRYGFLEAARNWRMLSNNTLGETFPLFHAHICIKTAFPLSVQNARETLPDVVKKKGCRGVWLG